MKKQNGDVTVTFKRTQDILKYLGEHKTTQKLVGFLRRNTKYGKLRTRQTRA
uniref:hypothetical protein n=1 Tax=Staphylococcus pseudintermedius TaxID=283734 RepID=UPI003C6FED0A